MDQNRCIPELVAHLQVDLFFKTTHSFLLLRNDSVKETSCHKHNKT